MSSCCPSCEQTGGSCSTLGQYPPDAAGHPIPYRLTDGEVSDFLANHGGDATLDLYLQSHVPAWGIVVQENYGEYLVWFTGAGRLAVVDVTNMSIAKEVQRADYASPDSGLAALVADLVSRTVRAGEGVAVTAGVVALAYLLYRVAR